MLRHSSDSEPGYTRQKKGRAWAYFDGEKRVTDRDEIDRLGALALPPAYTDAWFCKDSDGHIQATGQDARGRKQYRYHADYRAKQDASKYAGCREFGEALPKIRKRVEQDLKRRKLDRDSTPPSQDLGRNLFAINRSVATPADEGALSISCGPILFETSESVEYDAEYELGRAGELAPHEAKDA